MSHTKLRVLVGSHNPVKINAVRGAIAPLYPNRIVECEGIHAPSGVRDQPMTQAETREGALNRLAYLRDRGGADLYVSMEGGIDVLEDGPATFAYVAVADAMRLSVGRTAALSLPAHVYAALESGDELGIVMDRLFGTDNIKQKGGTVALVTNGNETRESVYTQALVLAMAPFLHPEFYDARGTSPGAVVSSE
ncbi:inosine/xanthosine triphosphatase [Luteibacter rhizovicinus]|uniref:Inosine/xanthosine triphosphatase n=1 Tax=Luteibacter rhizovicinus TaxID=242606 RepID=A0A4R3YL94_9GAMM|nr:inosine/xanthosine triphosphatase [Luteibacter rhizovicinus]TCV93337.1 inosine/xanthosine triphosphatase [Luteibacter rhizovicinus]